MLLDFYLNDRTRHVLKILAIVLVLIGAFLLRMWDIDSRDLIGDEAAYAFRSVGYVDYLGTSFQTQPIEWFKDQELPWWTTLSFHDHPPFGFLVQHTFFQLFGDNTTTARLPAILLGTASVFLIYVISRRFFDEYTGIIAAILFAVSSASVWIFRTSLLEPILIFLILLNVYLFLRFTEETAWRRKYWWLFGGTLGLIFLTKYTGIFIVPLYAMYLFLFYKGTFKDWRIYAASCLTLFLFLPVIIYNIALFKAVGHFDLQIAYLLGQETPEWSGLLGKTQSSFSDVFTNWAGLYGIAMTILFCVGVLWSFAVYKWQKNKYIVFLWLYLFFITLLLLLIGAADRFLVLYMPAIVLLSAYGIIQLWQFKKDSVWRSIFLTCALVLISSEMLFTFNKNFIEYQDFGIAKLDQYFEQEFKGKQSGAVPEADNLHLTKIIQDFSSQQNIQQEQSLYAIIYNDNITLSTLQWVFYRRFFYENVPTFFVENFNQALAVFGADFFKDFTLYFVQSTEHTLLNEFKRGKTAGLDFETRLIERGVKPDAVIYNKDGVPMFKIYKFFVPPHI